MSAHVDGKTLFGLVLLIVIVAVVSAQSAASAQDGGGFVDVTNAAGLETSELVENVSWADIDNDGDADLLMTGQDLLRLFRNDANLGQDAFTEITASAGLPAATGLHVGSTFADIDNDGDLDFYVVKFTDGQDLLFENNGDSTFTEIGAAAGIAVERSSRGIVSLDANNDGLIDFFVTAIGPHILYINQGDGTFVDEAASYGVDSDNVGVGAVSADVNGDGHVDLFVGNRSDDPDVPNDLFLGSCVSFEQAEDNYGITQTGLGMGVVAFDYDGDADIDLYWTTWPGTSGQPTENALYRNDGGNFVDVAAGHGVGDAGGWGISAAVGDYDSDGWEDLFVTNGFSDDTTESVLFRNTDGTGFSNQTAVLSGLPADGRGVAWADYDLDGDLDLAVSSDAGQTTRLYRNEIVESGVSWLRLDLTGTVSNRSAIGARVEIDLGDRTLVRYVSGGEGRGNQGELPVFFGLGDADVSAVGDARIFWPASGEQVVPIDELNATVQVTEASTAPVDPCSAQDTDIPVSPERLCGGLDVTVNLALGQRPTQGDDVILGTPGDDVIDGLGGRDTICGLQGDDVIEAGDGFDTVLAGVGDDTVIGGAGNDLLVGGPGNDTIRGENGSDRIRGGGGNDTIDAGNGADIVRGGDGNDVIRGGTHDDELYGNVGRDTIFGQGGSDVIRGGAWRDAMDGGAGSDACTLSDPQGIVETRASCESGVFNR